MEECPCVSPGPEKQMPSWDEMFKGFMWGEMLVRGKGWELEKAVRATRLSCWSDLCGGARAERKKVLDFSAVLSKCHQGSQEWVCLSIPDALSHWSGSSQWKA